MDYTKILKKSSFIFFLFLISFQKNIKNTSKKQIEDTYDLIIIGGGMAGYSAAHAANNFGKKTLLIHDEKKIGGITMNIGAIPTKHLVKVANEIRNITNPIFTGIEGRKPMVSKKEIKKAKDEILNNTRVNKFLKNLNLMKNLTILNGIGRFIDENSIEVNGKIYTSSKYLIATGSKTKIPYIKGLDKIKYTTIKCACEIDPNVKSITIIGGGYLGMELSMVYSQLGLKVTVLERASRVLKTEMEDVSHILEKSLVRDKIKIYKNFFIKELTKKGKTIEIIGIHNGRPKKIIENGVIFLATGITGNTLSLNLEKANVKTGRKNMIITDKYMQTSNPNIYSAGDCVNSPCFVCVADMEARVAVRNMFGDKVEMNYEYYPWTTFTYPQVAGAGYDERQAIRQGIPYESRKLDIKDTPYSIITNEKEGFIKILRHKLSKRVIGARLVCNNAGEMISFISFLIKNKMKTSALVDNMYPYLTCSEALKNTAIQFKEKNLTCCIP